MFVSSCDGYDPRCENLSFQNVYFDNIYDCMLPKKMAKEIMAICKIWKKWQTYFIL